MIRRVPLSTVFVACVLVGASEDEAEQAVRRALAPEPGPRPPRPGSPAAATRGTHRAERRRPVCP